MNNILGLIRKANKLIVGTELTIKKVRANEVRLVLLATDASNNTKKLVYDKTGHYGVEVLEVFTSMELSKPIGKSHIMVLGIADNGFSKIILSQTKEVNKYGQESNSEKR